MPFIFTGDLSHISGDAPWNHLTVELSLADQPAIADQASKVTYGGATRSTTTYDGTFTFTDLPHDPPARWQVAVKFPAPVLINGRREILLTEEFNSGADGATIDLANVVGINPPPIPSAVDQAEATLQGLVTDASGYATAADQSATDAANVAATLDPGQPNGVATLDANGRLTENADAARITQGTLDPARLPDTYAPLDKVESYREGPQNTLAGEGSAALVDPAETDASSNFVGGYRNTTYGAASLTVNGRGFKNTAIGHGALRENTDGYRNTAVGNDALRENIGGVGTDPISPTDPGTRNTAVGDLALVINTTGFANTAMGVDAAQTNDSGDYNSAFGYLAYSGTWNQTTQHHKHADENTAMGSRALHMTATDGLTGADGNTAVGANAGRDNVTGATNTLVGRDANAAVDGVNNAVAVGAASTASSSLATAVGTSASATNTGSTSLGSAAVASGLRSTALGRLATSAHTDSVAIGSSTATTADNQVHIGPRMLDIGALSSPGYPSADTARLNVYDNGGTLTLRVIWPGGASTTLATA